MNFRDTVHDPMTSTEAVKWPGGQNEDPPTVVDGTLFKAIGLDQLLRRPATVGGCFVDWTYRTCLLTATRLIVGLMFTQAVRVYLTLGDLQMFLPTVLLIAIAFNGMFKGHVMVTHADRLHDVLDVAQYGYAAAGRADPSKLRRCRTAMSVWLRVFVANMAVSVIVWTVIPLIINDPVPFPKLDGTVGRYRQTAYNWWYPVSEAMFNWTPVWAAICVVETAVCSLNVFCWTLFATYTVTVCEALSAQFRTLTVAYETLGRPRRAPGSFVRESDRMKADRCYEELIDHVKDNQKVIMKYDEFADIVKPAVFSQISVGTFAVITFVFISILAYFSGLSILSARYFVSSMVFAFHLFIYCYVLARLEAAKSSVNCGLYSCGWTEMDLKCQKAVLLAMRMNSAHNRLIKMSSNSVVNLEMFTRVMKSSFSIVSVLLNTRGEKTTVT